MPLVEAVRERTVTWLQGKLQQGAVARTTSSNRVVPNDREVSFRFKSWHVEGEGRLFDFFYAS